MNTRRLGGRGESIAAEYLTAKGYTIHRRNFRSRRGEVDIICGRGDTIVYVEVKCWTANSTAALEYAINGKKQRRIIDAARVFLMEEAALCDRRHRFDVVFVDNENGRIKHIEGAFESPWPG